MEFKCFRLNIAVFFVGIIACSSASAALNVQAFSNVHIPSLSPSGLTGALSSTSIITNGTGRRLMIDADHFEVLCSSGNVLDSDGVIRVQNNANWTSASDGLHFNNHVHVQYRVFAEHVFLACGTGSNVIQVIERRSQANGGAC